ncbi:MAG: anti-sigma factor antagonist [Chrysiogenales bacterium]|nr:MAG: anti-sigma factor antagonist [Chrysiogenales bacterium]
MKINTILDESVAIIQVEGSLSSEEKIIFEKEVNIHVEAGHHLIVDLSKVTFIDSATLGSIVKYFTIFRKGGKHLLLSSINHQIYEVFQLTGITRQIKIFETPEAAVDFIRGG